MSGELVGRRKLVLNADGRDVSSNQTYTSSLMRSRIQKDKEFMSKANCVGEDPNLFYPERGENCAKVWAICNACEVQQACLDYALETDEKDGFWGGLSPRKRHKLAMKLKRGA